MLPKRRSSLPQSSGGPGVPIAAVARTPKRWRPRCPQSAEEPVSPKQRSPLPQSGIEPGIPKPAKTLARKLQGPLPQSGGGPGVSKAAEAHTPMRRRPHGAQSGGGFGATFRVGGGEGGGGGSGGGVRGQVEGPGGGGGSDPYMHGLKWPSHRADHLEVQMYGQKILQQGGGGMVGGT